MSDNKAKRYCFTINNPTEEDYASLQRAAEHCVYLVAQKERGEEGTVHLQGFLILKRTNRLNWLKTHINSRAHFEVARGSNKEASDYCKKEESRVTGDEAWSIELGELPQRQAAGKASERLERAAEELDTIKEGFKRPSEVPSMVLLQSGFVAAYKEITADILGPYRPQLKIITLVGPPGTGKSYSIQQLFPNHGRIICGNNGVWAMNPLAPVMVLEEFCGQITLQRMLQLLDPYPLSLEVKGGMRPAMYTTFIITSNTEPDGWYRTDIAGDRIAKRSDAVKALWDRLGYETVDFHPTRTCGYYLQPDPATMSVQAMRDFFMAELRSICHIEEEQQDDAPVASTYMLDDSIINTQ